MMAAVSPTTTTTTNDPVVEQLYNLAKTWTESSPTPATLVPFTVSLMTAVQGIVTEKGKGPYKKQVVLTVLRIIIEHEANCLSSDDRQALVLALETTVPSAIDVAVGISTGEIDLQKHATQCGKIWKGCFPCCFSTAQ